MPKYLNELEKHSKTHGERTILCAFLDWTNSQGFEFGKWNESKEGERDLLLPISLRQEDLLDRYFKIDATKLEQERRKLLEGLK